jgi:hypothetical protein
MDVAKFDIDQSCIATITSIVVRHNEKQGGKEVDSVRFPLVSRQEEQKT